MAEPDAELVGRAQAGDASALVALVQSQQTYVYSIARSIMANPADAGDLTQEAFLRLLRALRSYRGETKFTSWLYRLVANVCLDELRRRGQRVGSLDATDDRESSGLQVEDADPWTRPETWSERRESAVEVRRALAMLPINQRLALTLHYFDDMRYEDVATVMRLPLNTVKSHIRRGKQQLALILGQTNSGSKETSCSAVR